MNGLPKSLLLDTNIWLDNYIGTRPATGRSRKLIDYALDHGVELFYPVVSFADIYYNIAAYMKRSAKTDSGSISEEEASAIKEFAFSCLRNMHEMATAVGADGSDAWLGMKLYSVHRDLEDDMILAAMERSKAAFLVTNDLKLIRHASCPAMTAEDMLDYLKAFGE